MKTSPLKKKITLKKTVLFNIQTIFFTSTRRKPVYQKNSQLQSVSHHSILGACLACQHYLTATQGQHHQGKLYTCLFSYLNKLYLSGQTTLESQTPSLFSYLQSTVTAVSLQT